MKQTTNYQLPQWEETDRIMMKDFNDAFANVEKYCGNCRIFAGSYVGTGEYGQEHPNKLEFSFRPLLIFMNVSSITHRNFVPAYYIFFRPASNAAVPENDPAIRLTWTENGVSWYFDTYAGTTVDNTKKQFNTLGQTYHYIAIGD